MSWDHSNLQRWGDRIGHFIITSNLMMDVVYTLKITLGSAQVQKKGWSSYMTIFPSFGRQRQRQKAPYKLEANLGYIVQG